VSLTSVASGDGVDARLATIGVRNRSCLVWFKGRIRPSGSHSWPSPTTHRLRIGRPHRRMSSSRLPSFVAASRRGRLVLLHQQELLTIDIASLPIRALGQSMTKKEGRAGRENGDGSRQP
jgi:hypothetical protein